MDKDKISDLECKLDEIESCCKEYESIFSPIEISASKLSELKLNSRDFDLRDLYIDTGDFDSDDDFVVRDVVKK